MDPPNKKPRKAVKPLKGREQADSGQNNRFMDLFSLYSEGCMFPLLQKFLTVNDITNLSLTCRDMNLKVKSARLSSNPCIIWEKRMRTKIGYQTIELYNDDSEESNEASEVLQIQSFCFNLHDRHHPTSKSILVKMDLENLLWIEDGPDSRHLLGQSQETVTPSATRMRFWIIAPSRSYQDRERFFICHPDDFHGNDWTFFIGENNDYITDDKDWSEEEQEHIRQSMVIVHRCAKQIENFRDSTIYPTAEYLMNRLPRWLHAYFPESFDGSVDTAKDRETEVEITYCPAPSYEAWMTHQAAYCDGIYAYDLDEIPWYNDDERISRTTLPNKWLHRF